MGWCIDCHRKTDVNTKGNNLLYDKAGWKSTATKKAMKAEDIGGLRVLQVPLLTD